MHDQEPALSGARKVIIDELRRTHSHQLQFIEELDDKAETVMRLGVFAVTGVAVFLTYAARPDSSIDFSNVESALVLSGALFQLLSFYTVLRSYGVLGRPRVVEIADLTSRRNPEQRDDAALYELISGSHRKAIKKTSQTYAEISGALSFATLTLFLGALLYFIAIYLSVQV